jgi:uncharacterized protein YcbK (DUF882 family)
MKSSLLVLALSCAVAGTADADLPRRPQQRATTNVVSHPTTPAGYFYTVRGWHTPDPNATIQRDASNRPLFVIHAMALNERVAFPAASPRGGFAPDAINQISHTVRESTTGNEHPIDPRTLDVLYQIQAHFNAQEIRVVSAYRTPKTGNSQGNHGRGRAIDFVVPGATDSDVGRFARDHGFVGVGVYPNAGFVHVDVRASSYFWIDSSGPGAPSRERGILLDVAMRADSQARARGETAPPPILANGVIPALEEEDL